MSEIKVVSKVLFIILLQMANLGNCLLYFLCHTFYCSFDLHINWRLQLSPPTRNNAIQPKAPRSIVLEPKLPKTKSQC